MFFEIFERIIKRSLKNSCDDVIILLYLLKRGIGMNSGTYCKNLTDGLLIVMAVLALIGLVVEFTAFDGEHIMNHPTTSEDITVKSPLDNPYADSYLKLFAAFLITAVIGFGARKAPVVSILASACTIVVSVNFFASELIKSFPFLYVLIAFTSLAGNIVYTCFHYFENKSKNLSKGEE